LNIRLSKKTGGTNGDCAFSKAKLIDFSSDVIMMTITREVRTHRIHTKKKRKKRKEKRKKKKEKNPRAFLEALKVARAYKEL